MEVLKGNDIKPFFLLKVLFIWANISFYVIVILMILDQSAIRILPWIACKIVLHSFLMNCK